jgi:hypothetical protein
MKPRLDPVRLDLPIRDLATEPIDAEGVREMVRSFVVARVKCRKHEPAVGAIQVRVEPGRAVVEVAPCCTLTAKELGARLRKIKGVADDRVPDVIAPGQRLIRAGNSPLAIASAPPVPFVPLLTTGTGRRAVSKEVAAAYAKAGRLHHIARTNGDSVEVYSAETADDEMLATHAPGGTVPPCTAENIRIRTKRLCTEAARLALTEGRPLSDYAAMVDWDTQMMHIKPKGMLREMFVSAGDVPALVQEMDENEGETLLVFIFADGRFDRTMRVTGRGFFVGKDGEA